MVYVNLLYKGTLIERRHEFRAQCRSQSCSSLLLNLRSGLSNDDREREK